MAINFDVSNDFLVMDWEDPVDYYERLTDSTFASPVTVNYCLRRQIDKGTIGGDESDLLTETTIWEIWSNNVDFTPVRGDKIVDSDNKTWIVETLDYCDRISRYRLMCRAANQGYNQ